MGLVVFEVVVLEDLQAEVVVMAVKAVPPTTMPAHCKNSRLEKPAGRNMSFLFWISFPSSAILPPPQDIQILMVICAKVIIL
jgi:hypothetical protein